MTGLRDTGKSALPTRLRHSDRCRVCGPLTETPGRSPWWKPLPNSAPASMGLVRYSYALGFLAGWFAYWIVLAYA